jgi:hypothetical protein
MSAQVRRDEHGRIVKGSPSLNPRGAAAREQRMFTSDQVTKDFLGLLDEPVTVKVGGVEKQMPAIVAIYRKMVQMAAEGDWGAIKKVVELREKYADARTAVLCGLATELVEMKKAYQERDEKMPDMVWKMVQHAEEAVDIGQFRPG